MSIVSGSNLLGRPCRHPLLILAVTLLSAVAAPDASAQADGFTAVRAEVDFSDKLRIWDGFGFNYVETAHTDDYDAFAQEYGGFSDMRALRT